MKIDPRIALSETGFLFHAATGDSFTVNPVGRDLLEWIRAGADRAALIARLGETYEVDAEQAEEDLDDFLHFLYQLKILIDG